MIRLSPREQELLDWLVTELSGKEIAFNMGIKYGTLKEYAFRLARKLGCQNRIEIIVRAYQGRLPVQPRGVIPSPS